MGKELSHDEIAASEPDEESRSSTSSSVHVLTCGGKSRRGIDLGVRGEMGGNSFSKNRAEADEGPLSSGSCPGACLDGS